MNFGSIALWLKSTVIGIIILGTIGSIFAILLWKLIRSIFVKWLPQGLRIYKKYEYKHGWRYGYIAGYIIGDKDIPKINIFIAYHIASLIVALVCFLSFAALFVYVLPKNTHNLLTIGSYAFIVLAILSVVWAKREFHMFKFLYNYALKELLNKADASYDSKMKESNSK